MEKDIDQKSVDAVLDKIVYAVNNDIKLFTKDFTEEEIEISLMIFDYNYVFIRNEIVFELFPFFFSSFIKTHNPFPFNFSDDLTIYMDEDF